MEETRQIIKYLDREALKLINLWQIQSEINSKLGGLILNPNSLDYLLEIVKEDDIYPTLEEKAALYCFKIVTNHPFVDGNKRTGMGAILWFIELNNAYFRRFSDDKVLEITVSIAEKRLSFEDLVDLIRARILFRRRPRLRYLRNKLPH